MLLCAKGKKGKVSVLHLLVVQYVGGLLFGPSEDHESDKLNSGFMSGIQYDSQKQST